MAFRLPAGPTPPTPCHLWVALLASLFLSYLYRCSASTSPDNGVAADRATLLSFKSLIVNDPSEALASWNETIDFCRWRGVTCGGGRRHTGRVTALDLGQLHLSGVLSPSLANLTFLTSLRLPGNQLYGVIPAEFGRLSHLRQLDLSSNSLSGEIPANLSECFRLSNVTLRSNQLKGDIPAALGSLLELHSLNLGLNSLSGDIPPSLGNLSSVSVLILSDNMLEGEIPPVLGGLSHLRVLGLGRNNLSGKIPPSLFNLTSLEEFDANYNQLTGTLPDDIGESLPRLKWFLMTSNLLQGNIPSSFPNASGLLYLEMKYNSFSGSFPSNLGTLQSLSSLMLGGNRLVGGASDGWSFLTALTNCSNLQVLDMGGNLLSGPLPASIGNMSQMLIALQTGASQISGPIPPEIGNLVNLEFLNIQRNILTGSIPDTVSKLRNLGTLTFARNKLSGEIPSAIGNLTSLTGLYLNNNELEGSIPRELAACTSLLSLNLSFNNLSGTIPPGILSLPSLTLFLDMSHNSLSGPLPPDLGSETKVGQIAISNNRLTGEIPSSLGDCSSLEAIFLGANMLHGVIPTHLSNLRALLKMDLSRNNLSGRIPSFLGRLKYLNLSFNDFEGEVPRGGVFENMTATSVYGNKQLCGGNPLLRLQHCPPHPIPGNKKSHRARTLLLAVIIVTIFSLLLLIFLLVSYHRRGGRMIHDSVLVPLPGEQYVKVSYSELFRATEGFATHNLIGRGSFGAVYRGTLPLNVGHGHDDGVVEKSVAIKVFDLQEKNAAVKNFESECEALSRVRHRNLAKIITCCSSIDTGGRDFKALVLELMPNGSLERWLHPAQLVASPPAASAATGAAVRDHLEGAPGGSRLSFMQLLDIAVDVASALDYLHNHGQVPIAHCDLKPSNVLLDSDMNAVVSDFGLARFILRPATTESTTAGIRGTIGYIPPEYGQSSKASTSGDIYSYGVLLLEMFTGRRPTEDAFGADLSLRRYVELAFPERVMDIVDPCLLQATPPWPANCSANDQEGPSTSASSAPEGGGRLPEAQCIVSAVRVGLTCSSESPRDRPEIGDVIRELHGIAKRMQGR